MVFETCFLPWLDRKLALKFGPIEFLPFAEEFKKTLTDEVAEYLDDYFAQYVDYQGEPVSNILICTYGDKGVSPLTDEQRKKVRRAVDALMFCSISQVVRNSVAINNRSWGPPTSDAFELFLQTFDPEKDHIAVTAGSTTHCWGKEDITFPKPLSTGGSVWDFDEEMLLALSKCLSGGISKTRERVFRSLEWFRLAHTEQSQTSVFSKVVMMGSAFEILLDLPEGQKSRNFIDSVHIILHSDDFRMGTGVRHIKKTKFPCNLAGLWAGRFYDLRSRVVHGDRVSVRNLRYTNRYIEEDMKWVGHLAVADVVFYDLVAHLLFENHLLGRQARKMAQDLSKTSSSSIQELEKSCFGWLHGSKDVHKSLGWLKKRASL